MRRMIIPITNEGLFRLRKRLEELKLSKSSIPAESQHAYDTGGYWHDNNAFEEAQRAQATIDGEIAEIEAVIGNYHLIEEMKVNTKHVGIGTVATIRVSNPDEVVDLTILGPFDTNPSQFIISDRAPLAEALLGKSVGRKATFQKRSIEILEIRRWEPPAQEKSDEAAFGLAETVP